MRHYELFVRDEAQDEAEEIKKWYEAKSPGLGDRFSDTVEVTYMGLRSTPFYQVRKAKQGALLADAQPGVLPAWHKVLPGTAHRSTFF